MSIHTRCLPRIATTPAHRTQWRRIPIRCYASTGADDPPWFQQLRSEMLRRDATSSREYIDLNTHHKLINTLSAFLPREWCRRLHAGKVLPLGHHLVWFNPSMPVDQLLPDGTDPLQSPGWPWVRRMWAGGSLRLRPDEYYDDEKGFAANTELVCAERIQDVHLRGQADAAKIFITLERRFTRLGTLHDKYVAPLRSKGLAKISGPQSHFRAQLENEEWGDATLKEQRILVFLKERTSAELDAIKAGHMAPVRYLESPGESDFTHTLTPTRSLLFRYSALTFNAHLIHLDRDYARNVEGHRNLLVHGPLSLTLMLQAIGGYIQGNTGGRHVMESIEYRNLAPLYCDEEMRICGVRKKVSNAGNLYDVWIEGPTGGVAVKATVRTTAKPVTKASDRRQISQTITKTSVHQEKDIFLTRETEPRQKEMPSGQLENKKDTKSTAKDKLSKARHASTPEEEQSEIAKAQQGSGGDECTRLKTSG